MELLNLFITATIPIVKVLLVTLLGSYLALDRVNILGAETRKHLNTVVFYVFNPPLVGTNLAKTITYESIVKLWFMPVNVFLTFLFGSMFGWIVIQLTKPPTHLRGLILGCCAAGNLGNMLLIIIPAVCKEKGSPFGDPDVCYTYGMAYVSLSMAIGSIYLWSYVYNIVRVYSRSNKESISTSKFSNKSSTSDLASCMEPLLDSGGISVAEDNADRFTPSYTVHGGRNEVAVSENLGIKQKLGILVKKLNLKRLFAPSIIGAVVGFVIGVVPQIRSLLIGNDAPLRVLQDTASFLADGAIPVLTLIIGGNLVRGLKEKGLQKSLIVGIIIARYVALPLTGIVLVKAAIRFGWVHSDPLYQFVLLLQFAVPPAMNIGTITQLFGAGESECSVIMLWTYALASVSLTFWCTFFMWLVAHSPSLI